MPAPTAILANRSSAPRAKSAEVALPRCIVVTGPRGAGKTRWLQQCVRSLTEWQPTARLAVPLVEEGRTRMELFSQGTPAGAVRKPFLTCTCCPAVADLPGNVRALVATAQADWLFVELPVIAAPGLLTEFDRTLRWPRSLAACLTPAWAKAQRAKSLSPIQSRLLKKAGIVIASPLDAARAVDRLLPACGAYTATCTVSP